MLLNISQHSAETLQEQIISQIRRRILCGELGPDEGLLSIRSLSKNLQVGVNTVQRAYEHLLREELVYARPGKGFFVAPLGPDDIAAITRTRFAESLKALVAQARREGLSDREMNRIFTRLRTELGEDDA